MPYKDPEKNRAASKKWREAHPEKCAEYAKNYDLRNREKRRLAIAERRLTPEKQAAEKAYREQYNIEYIEENRAQGRKFNQTPRGKQLRREWAKAHPKERYEYIKKYIAENPEAHAAHCAVRNAVRCGRLKKQPCAICGTLPVGAHHENYSRPLEVVWLCPQHHGKTWRKQCP